MPGLTLVTARIRLWLREPTMIVMGAIPATCLLPFAFFALTLGDQWSQGAGALAIPGVIGLWIASFQDPNVVAPNRILTICLLVLGLAALAPFTVAASIGFLKDPTLPTSWSGAFFCWTFFGPTLCTLAFIFAHAISRIRHRVSRKSLKGT